MGSRWMGNGHGGLRCWWAQSGVGGVGWGGVGGGGGGGAGVGAGARTALGRQDDGVESPPLRLLCQELLVLPDALRQALTRLLQGQGQCLVVGRPRGGGAAVKPAPRNPAACVEGAGGHDTSMTHT